MKRFLLLAITTIVMVGCSNFAEQDALPSKVVGTPDTIYATFDEAEADSRTYVEQGKYLRWNEGDEISFFPVTYNMQYRFKGKTGDNNGAFEKITTDLVTGNELKNNYAVYPYKASTAMSDEGIILFELPAVQHYAENSFGVGANTMVAITSGKDDNILRFKNCGGYLKLQLYGDATVKSIELKGNNGEKIAGASTITAVYGGEPSVAMADSATTSITLDCGDGVALGATADTATAFWFVVPPTTFENGFTVTVTNTEGAIFEKSTSNTTTIDRNTIQPMAEVEVVITPIELRTIYYKSISPNKVVTPYNTAAFGSTIISNTCGEDCMGEILFKDAITQIGEKAFYYEPHYEGNVEVWDNCLYSITIPNSVTSIGNKAFYNNNSLDGGITIPNSVKSIGDEAFYGCYNIDKLTISASVTYVGNYVFNGLDIYFAGSTPPTLATNALKGVERFIYVPYEYIEVYRSAWSEYVDKILGYDFEYNQPAPANNQIYYKTTDKKIIDEDRLYGPLGDIVATNYYSNSGVISSFDNGDLGVLTFKNDITEIGKAEFEYCETLKAVYIPKSVISIAGGYYELNYEDSGTRGAFSGLDSLEIVVIYGTPEIKGNPFVYTSGSSYGDETARVLAKFIGPLASADGRCLITEKTIHSFAPAGIEEYTIPVGITTIDSYAFNHCPNLKLITIPSNVNKIGYDAFNECYNVSVNITDLANWCKIVINNKYANPMYTGGEPLYLNGTLITTLTIPSSVTTIKKYVFEGVNVSEIVIGDNVTTIEDYAFEWNDATKITIGKNVKTIGAYAFNDTDTAGGNIYIKATTPPTAQFNQYGYWKAFDCNYTSRKIYVPRASVSKYKSATGWSAYADRIEPYDF